MKKNLKQFFAILLSVVMIAGLIPLISLPVANADTWDGTYTDGSGFSNNTITSARGLAYFLNRVANGNTYSGQTVYLATDVNLNNVDLCDAIPYYTTGFEGTFDGQGYTISNFRMTHDNHRVAMFRTAKNATFKNVTVTNVFVDDWASNNKKNGFAVFVGYGDGNLTFENVHISGGYVYGYNYVGGLVGEYGADNVLTFTNCSNSALIYADNDRAAGMVGHSKGRVYATNCSNTGEIYAGYSDAGGLAGWIEDDESYFVNCSNTGKVSTDSAAGGMVGYFGSKSNDNKMTITGCSNTGRIESRKSSSGGCAGGMAGKLDTDAGHVFSNNVNYGDIVATGESAGGIVGANMGGGTWTNCRNYGNIYGNGDNGGGILGEIEDDLQTFYNCLNAGNISSRNTGGGIMGWGSDSSAPSFERCFNYGNVSAGSYGGGILGGHNGGSSSNHNNFVECMNAGNVESADNGGGMVGEGNWTYITRCFNMGNISRKGGGTSKAYGGLIGWDVNDITDSYNVGNVTYGDCTGGILGGDTHGSYNNCYNAGSCTGGNKNRQIKAQDSSGSFTNCWSCSSVSGETQWNVTDAGGLRDLQNTLNSSVYCKDTWGVNNGYPILKWWRDNYFKFPVQLVDGSTNVVNATYAYNASFTAPARSKTGYTFNGWYTASSGGSRVWGPNATTVYAGVTAPTNTCGMTWNTGDDRPNVLPSTNPIKYYAQYTPNPYTIRFFGNGSSYGMMENLPMVYDTAKNLPAVGFFREYTVTYDHNYTGSTDTSETVAATFDGWARSAEGAKEFDNKQSVNNLTAELNGTVDLYAKWTLNAVTLPTPTRTGYDFGGWYGEEGCTTSIGAGGASYTPTADKTLYAKWTPITYTVSYDGNGKTSGTMDSSTHTFDVSSALTANGYGRAYTVTYDYKYTDLQNQAVTGSDTATAAFNGWATSADGEKVYNDGQSVLNLRDTAGNYPLFANWTLSTVTLPDPSRTGYQFGGWFTDSDCTQGEKAGGATVTPAADTTYYAKWTANAYKVHFNGTAATSGEMADQDFTYDAEQALTANAFKKEYTVAYEHNGGSGAASGTASAAFDGWAVSAGGNRIYIDQEAVCNLTATQNGTTDLYAVWGDMGSVTLPDSPMTGYTFNGWYSDEQLSNRVGGTGDSYTPAADGITLYAKHTINTYTITFKSEGGETLDEQTVNYNVTPMAPAIPKKDPSATQHFTGAWDKEIVAATEDTTYTAVYSGEDHTGGEATCSAKAVCDVCQAEYGEYNNNNHKNTHPTEAVAANCVTEGFTAGTYCDDCKSYISGHVSQGYDTTEAGHSYGGWTSNGDGTHTRTCSRCGAETANHSVSDDCYGGTATCLVKATCEGCGEKYGDLGAHDLTEVPAVAPSCLAPGHVAYWHCDVCDVNFTDSTGATQITAYQSGHTPGEPAQENVVAATCKDEGSYDEVVYCTVCNTELSREPKTIDKLTTHTPAAAVEENRVEATCTAAGSYNEVVYCSVCGAKLSTTPKTIDKLDHNLTHTAAVAPTCKDTGFAEYWYCDGCEKYFLTEDAATPLTREQLDEQGVVGTTDVHTPAAAVEENRVEATCTATGSYNEVVYCSVCGAKLSTTPKTIDQLAHHLTHTNAVAPTCKDTGFAEYWYCDGCEKYFLTEDATTPLTREELDAQGVVGTTDVHTPAAAVEENRVEATCTATGSYNEVVYCSVCGAKLSTTPKTIDQLAHHLTHTNAVAPTCKDTGFAEYWYCDGCEKYFLTEDAATPLTREELDAQGVVGTTDEHTPAAAVEENRVEATCTAAGSYNEVVYCSVCGAKLSTTPKTIDKLDHNLTHTAAVAPTCKDTGFAEYWYCDGCEKYFLTEDAATPLTREELDAQGVVGTTDEHTPAAAVEENRVEATCTATGSYNEVVYCSICGVKLSTMPKTIDKLDHNLTHTVAVAPTCKDAGFAEYWYCDGCEKYFLTEDAATPLTREQLDEQGVVGTTDDHTPAAAVEENRVEATCKDEGSYDEVIYCAVCEAELSRVAKPIARLTTHTPGDPVKENENAATCDTDGSYDIVVYCTVCEAEISRENHTIPAGHTAGDPVIENENAPTCTEAGSHDVAVYCTECGEEISRTTVTDPAKGHTWGEWEIVIPATDDEDGLAKHVCTACGEEETKPLSAIGEEITKTIQFVNIARMHYVIDLGDGETYAVYNSSTVQWISRQALRFRVVLYSGYSYDDIIIRANGMVIEPDADGYYSLPQTPETVVVTAEGAVKDDTTPGGKLSFWELLIRFFKSIVSFFTGVFGKAI